jgi:polysaccharide export outer membrane protein
MAYGQVQRLVRLIAVVAVALPLGSGCRTTGVYTEDLPREFAKSATPPYVIEPPDILLIDALRVVPLPPYKIEPLDGLFVQVTNTLPAEPISGVYTVEPEGTLNLGPSYGSVRVVDMTIDQAKAAIEERLNKVLTNAQVSLSLAQSRANQQIRGEHLVGPDGTVQLGLYGSVYIAGKTLEEAKAAIEAHLAKYLYKPEVSVDVFAYNSKVYYVITDGGGFGEQVVRVPLTGNETVLDAISQINGLPAVASKKGVWIARPTPSAQCACATLPVDWKNITRCADTSTNYQVMAGDRIYVMAQPLVSADTYLARLLAPAERIFGVTLLGASSIQTLQGRNLQGNQGGGFFP